MKSSKEDVEALLEDVRKAINENKVKPIPRNKNINSMAKIGYTWKDIKDEIYYLSYEDYISGPDIDRDYPDKDYFWKFKKILSGELFYIKLKILYKGNNELLIVSCHIDEVC